MAIKTIPSLVIGLGGTGKRALTHLKRRVLDTYQRDDLPWLRLLSIDADDAAVSNPPVISQTTGQLVQLGINEMRIIDQSDTPKIISNLDAPENRHIKDWYPDPDMNVDFPKAAKGSGQVRMFGRVGLYKGENLYTTYRWLQQAANEVSDPAAWDGFSGFSIDPGMQFVYIICSLCGGTGSGMFLDVAYMLRKLVGVDPAKRRFVGMFVLPEVYEPVVENQHLKRIHANTYAALRELDFLMNSPRRSFTIRGKDHTFLDYNRDVTPFDFVFLFSNKNKRGAVISQRQVSADKPMAADDRIAQYISETIMTDVLSPITERNESILCNIFTSPGDPDKIGDRTLYKTYSGVGVSSVKVPPLTQFQKLIELTIGNHVLDFLLRSHPDITEQALAKEFMSGQIAGVEELLSIRASLSDDPTYSRFRTKAFLEEFRLNRPSCINIIKQWVDNILADGVCLQSPLEIERAAATTHKDALERLRQALANSIRSYATDPHFGYAFVNEWIQELVKACNSKLAQLPVAKQVEGDPTRLSKQAFESLQHLGNDIQLPVAKDTVNILLERVADYYDEVGRSKRNINLLKSFYNDLLKLLEEMSGQLNGFVGRIQELEKSIEAGRSAAIAELDDVSDEKVLIDKCLVGRKEAERFVNFLLHKIWTQSNWNVAAPDLSDEIKQRICSELSYRLMEINSTSDGDERAQRIKTEVDNFVKQRLFNELFKTNVANGRIEEPTYVDSEGKSITFDFAPENLLSLMVAHSSPLWSVQTHQVGSATSPITFVGLNGTKVPNRLVEELQKQIPTFRPTDMVLSDAETRIVVKQYDPLYSLASLSNILDYENYYKSTDHKQNPMHTDVRFMSEPNPFLQWLSYKSPEAPSLKICSRGHDIGDALREMRQYCPDCFQSGVKTFIVEGKAACPNCSKVIEEDSRKCPHCLSILETQKQPCPGCLTEGKQNIEDMIIPKEEVPGGVHCSTCASLWSNICPYCNAALEKSTICTKGSDRCIFDSPPIVLCADCSCSVTPDTNRCPRCLKELKECQDCKRRGEPRRMIAANLRDCPICQSQKDLVASAS